MSVRVSTSPRQVTGGCPQGAILGVLLFNLTTDDLEDDSAYVATVGRPSVGGDDDSEEEEETAEARPRQGWGGDQDMDGCPYLSGGEDWGPEDRPHTGLGSHNCDDSPELAEEAYVHEATSPSNPLLSTPARAEQEETGFLSFTPSPIAEPGEIPLDGSDVQPQCGAARIVYSSEEDLTPPPEPTTTCLGEWVQ